MITRGVGITVARCFNTLAAPLESGLFHARYSFTITLPHWCRASYAHA